MAPSCVVVVHLASKCGVGCAVCMHGVLVGFSLSVPSLARVSAILFPIILTCARTLCMWMVCGVHYICRTIIVISSLSGWWCCDVGCWM